jgi:hypothetical protein
VVLAESFLERNGTLFQILATVIVAAVAGAGGWWLRSRQRKTKTFDYRVVSDIPIFNVLDRPRDLKVSYQNSDVSDPRVTRIRFRNTGNVEVDASDFEEDYRIERGNADFLDYTIIESSSRVGALAAISEIGIGTPQYIKIKPKTLGRGDWFTVQIVFDGGEGESISVVGRVKNETRPSAIYPSRAQLSYVNNAGKASYVFAAFPLVCAPLAYFTIEPRDWSTPAIFAVVTLLIITIGHVTSWRSRRNLYARLREGTTAPDPD